MKKIFFALAFLLLFSAIIPASADDWGWDMGDTGREDAQLLPGVRAILQRGGVDAANMQKNKRPNNRAIDY